MGEIVSIIDNCQVCRLGLIDGEISYIVPMNLDINSIKTS